MRTWFVLAFILAATSAHAEGWRTGAALGPGFTVARFGWEGPSQPFAIPGQPTPPVTTVEQGDTGIYVAVTAALRAVRPAGSAWVIGGELEGTVGIPIRNATLGWTTYDYAAGATASVVGEWRRGGRGPALTLAAGAALATFGGGVADIGAADNVADFERVVGPALKVAYGTGRAAIELRVAYLVGAHLSYAPVTLTARLQFGG